MPAVEVQKVGVLMLIRLMRQMRRPARSESLEKGAAAGAGERAAGKRARRIHEGMRAVRVAQKVIQTGVITNSLLQDSYSDRSDHK
jgi:hypothetical protein